MSLPGDLAARLEAAGLPTDLEGMLEAAVALWPDDASLHLERAPKRLHGNDEPWYFGGRRADYPNHEHGAIAAEAVAEWLLAAKEARPTRRAYGGSRSLPEDWDPKKRRAFLRRGQAHKGQDEPPGSVNPEEFEATYRPRGKPATRRRAATAKEAQRG